MFVPFDQGDAKIPDLDAYDGLGMHAASVVEQGDVSRARKAGPMGMAANDHLLVVVDDPLVQFALDLDQSLVVLGGTGRVADAEPLLEVFPEITHKEAVELPVLVVHVISLVAMNGEYGPAFILELKQPAKRKVDMERIKKEINMRKKIKVRGLRISDKNGVSLLKSKRPFKVYRVVVDFEKKVDKAENVKKLVGVIKQRTPKRVLTSKPDKTKNKKVKSIKWKMVNNKRYLFEIIAESGMYLKELVSGDSGRTNPSISKVLGNQAKVREFDLIGIED